MTIHRRNPRAKQRWLALLGAVALVGGLFGGSALATHDPGNTGFELDKNASNDTNVTRVGHLASNISATATSINICQTGAVPANGDVILIRAERMTVTANVAGSFGGNCPGTKQTYTVARGAGGTTATAQAGGAQNIGAAVSLITEAVPKFGPDWNQVYAAVQADANTKCTSLGLVECAFIYDGIGPSIFTQGSTKDHLPLEGWRHTDGSSPDKGEIINAYAAKAIVGGDQFLYFGMDRYAVDGSTDIGFWFFKDEVAAITTGPDAGTFSGTHTVGDILMLGTFTQGGATTNIRVFTWVGNDDPTAVLGGVRGPDADFKDCISTLPTPPNVDDDGCATVNDTTIEVPWNYTFKGSSTGGWVPAGGFFEGGVNLSDLGLEGCFSSFLAETRSSPELNAILKDFALGTFEACQSSLTTTPADGSDEPEPLPDGDTLPEIQIGTDGTVDVKDLADLTISGISAWSGTLDFWLCGPIATGTCDGTTNVGTKIGDPIDVDEATPQPIASEAATVSQVGRYCWRGVFTSDTNGVRDATDSSAGECFEVLPVQPILSTQAIDAEGDPITTAVPFGTAIYDEADLSGTAKQPRDPIINGTTAGADAGGKIVFKLYGPSTAEDDCGPLAAGFPAAGIEVTVNGDDFYDTLASPFTPEAPGLYHWKATYTPDTSGNTLGATHNDDCDETAEQVQVQQLQPSMTTAQNFVPNDAATVTVGSGAGDLAGSVVFKLYVNDATCVGTPAYTSSAINIATGTGTALSRTVTSSNSTAYSTTGTTFRWVVEYTSTNAAHLSVTSPCGNETSSITVNDGVAYPTPPPASD